ncbi:acetyltransferase [Vibrio cincinnatiensis]|nr:acetyltransferase [Vibrio cincinnatiensis]
MVTAVAFEFGVMRCQPLRRALSVRRKLCNQGYPFLRIIYISSTLCLGLYF